ncbi:hypothetical protein F7Q99_11770 [Streptomyces kaniharaensis]|uniref:Uncharacterized protein n=1 Tax=Streptomyces kaniharaensis TaxID=212423 RepID=A0A6N7KN27_9ACTN|nr:hypothetical protein [Streptomyces kaniharaensis]MQS12952.1 hypothetical protein [Streptomyces kaniharaensis]
MNHRRLAGALPAALLVTGTALAVTGVLVLSGATDWAVPSTALIAAGVHLLISYARAVHAAPI